MKIVISNNGFLGIARISTRAVPRHVKLGGKRFNLTKIDKKFVVIDNVASFGFKGRELKFKFSLICDAIATLSRFVDESAEKVWEKGKLYVLHNEDDVAAICVVFDSNMVLVAPLMEVDVDVSKPLPTMF